ncbi:MAG: hypothetical protein GX234_00785 [Clostridiales bacterium]|nr:hypothetical protein [Clostridiales bacterium]
MAQDIFQEITGVALQAEKEEYLSEQDLQQLNAEFLELPTYNNTTKENSVWEFYFVPEEFNQNSQCNDEEYLVSVSSYQDEPCITLKKRSKLGDFINEKFSRISKKQFRSLLLENYEWMKHSGELLLLELYNKFKLWNMKIGVLLECARKQLLLAEEQLLVTLDHYRIIPGNLSIFRQNPLCQQMKRGSYRITVKDLGSNYSGMNCREIISSLSAV